MKCSKCNNNIFEGQEVCLNCGHILGYESELSKRCIHCSREIPIAYKKCPFCKKKQKKKRYVLKTILVLFVLLVDYILLTYLYSPDTFIIKKEYKEKCESISYKELIRENKKNIGTLIKVSGTIKDVKKRGTIFNIITITLETNGNEYEIIFNNKNDIGLMDLDIITVYGKYKELKGNTPVINAKYIIIKNTD